MLDEVGILEALGNIDVERAEDGGLGEALTLPAHRAGRGIVGPAFVGIDFSRIARVPRIAVAPIGIGDGKISRLYVTCVAADGEGQRDD